MSFSKFLRKFIYSKRLKKTGKNFYIAEKVKIFSAKNMEIGKNVWISPGCTFGATGSLKIGNNVVIGPEVFIWTDNHDFQKPERLPFNKAVIKKPVIIEDNVWLGGRCCIAPGVRIGEGAVVAMGAVVSKDVPPCAVVGGNPAKIIKYRDIDQYYMLKNKQIF